jgi:hypothetical protein
VVLAPGGRSDPGGLPALVLRCRPLWRLAYGGTALVLLALGASVLASDMAPAGPGPVTLLAAAALFLLGAGCAHFFLRFCCARLLLSDGGFRLVGPLRDVGEVAWVDVVDWRRVPRPGGHGTLQIVHGLERSRLSVPLIYEDGHLLEIGLGQRRFPVW